MWKKILVMAVLGIATAAPFLTAGCASSATNQPNAVTGMVSNLPDSQNPRYQDQKHHFRPEWVDATGHLAPSFVSIWGRIRDRVSCGALRIAADAQLTSSITVIQR